MSLFGKEFDGLGATAVLAAKEAHLFRPRCWRDERERYAESGKYAFEDAGCPAEAEGRDDTLPAEGMDFLDDSPVAIFDVGAEEISQTDRVNLIDGARSAFDFGCRHINDDEVSTV